MTKDERIQIFEDTKETIKNGYHIENGRGVKLKLSQAEMKTARTYLPGDKVPVPKYASGSRTETLCRNEDSFVLAKKLQDKTGERALVLNMASPVHPGGGAENGSAAQEEELCRRSTLIAPLTSKEAKKFYSFGKSAKTKLGTDAVIISPNVEVIKDTDGSYLDESFVVSVITCAAPNIRGGMGGISREQYDVLLQRRMRRMLDAAAAEGYRNLVLGAWGCGAFRNDPEDIAPRFKEAIAKSEGLFDYVWFAVLDNTPGRKNYKTFSELFGL